MKCQPEILAMEKKSGMQSWSEHYATAACSPRPGYFNLTISQSDWPLCRPAGHQNCASCPGYLKALTCACADGDSRYRSNSLAPAARVPAILSGLASMETMILWKAGSALTSMSSPEVIDGWRMNGGTPQMM